MAKYLATAQLFIAPNLVPEGTKFTIDDSWSPPALHVEPLDEAAEKAVAAWFKKHPSAQINAVDELPSSGFVVDEEASPVSDVVDLSSAEAVTAKAKPGPTDGGKIA